ncbi:MAG: sarcosine oxidase subunit alpha family protein [Hyphomicrobiaceae bacterium]
MNDAVATTTRIAGTDASHMRLAEGGLIDRSRILSFTFDGRPYRGYAGDTLASALVANGVRLIGRSFKYHRPRGLISAGPEEPNALVELRSGARREPNTRATTVELYDGLEATSQNRWPSLKFDLLSINGLLSPAIAAGFYYKTFMWPASWWERVYEPLIRRAAGLGRASGEPDPDTYEKAHLHCDVLVVGSGPAGLSAALAAGRAGARVVLAEDDFTLGGRLLLDHKTIDAQPSASWAARIEQEIRALKDVRILRRTAVVASYDHGTFAAVERVSDHVPVPAAHVPRQRLWRIIARQCIVAAGAIERPLVFAGNDRPGVMLAAAARAYVNRFAALPGRRAVVAAATDDAALTARDLAYHGADVCAVVDVGQASSTVLEEAARSVGARYFPRSSVERTFGQLGVEGVAISDERGVQTRFDCDLVCMSGGWSPNVQLVRHRGGRAPWSERVMAFLPGSLPPGMQVIGAANGDLGLAEAVQAGSHGGADAARKCGFEARIGEFPTVPTESSGVSPTISLAGRRLRGKAFVDYQNDVTVDDIALANREGFGVTEHMKRYTTLGMATDQGKTSNVNGVALLAELTRQTVAEAGTTTFRPPVQPIAIGVLAGHHRGKDFRPTRLTPTHAWAAEQGAVFVESGPWLRAQWYPRDGEKDWLESVNREVRAVRSAAGVCDVSTLGKIDVQGGDAASFLDFVYANTMSTLKVGRARYGLMLREDGFVLDDGTVSRLGERQFLVTTTTANAARVLSHFEFCQQWLRPDLDVAITNVTGQWAQFSIAGPHSRKVLGLLAADPSDVSDDALPHLGIRNVVLIGGIAARACRISYSGELAFEIAVPADYGDAVIRRLMSVGREHGLTPYGTEALGVLRIEKGHVAGNEINGQTTARDLGLGSFVSRKKDFIGRAMAERPALLEPGRPALVGLKPIDAAARLRAGSHLVAEGAEPVAANDLGYVTSVAYSPTLGMWLALGLLAGGASQRGARVRLWDPVRSGDIGVEVVDPTFYDPEGGRMRGA